MGSVSVSSCRCCMFVSCFLMVCHTLQLLCVRSVEVMSSSHFSFVYFVIMSVSLSPVCMVSLSNGFPEYCFWYASYKLFDSSMKPGM